MTALRKGIGRALLGALVYLEAHAPTASRSLIHAGLAFSTDLIAYRDAKFSLVYKRTKLPEFLVMPWLLRVTKRTFGSSGNVEGNKPSTTAEANRSGPRYGEAQRVGHRRWAYFNDRRVDAVVQLVEDCLVEPEFPKRLSADAERTIATASRRARGWVIRDKSPAKISLRIIGLLLNWTQRLVKVRLAEARQFMKESEEVRRVFQLRGHSSVPSEEPGTVNSPGVCPQSARARRTPM